MQNDDILTSLSFLYEYSRLLDQNGQGAASLGLTDLSTEDLIKYNLLNILLYLCTCSNENDLNISVISDILGQPTTYADCTASASNNHIDNSILSILPLSFQVLVNADIANGITSLENGGDEASLAYTLFLVYQLTFTRFYNNCTVDALQQKNESLYNLLLGLNSYIQQSILNSSGPRFNPETGTIDAETFRVDPQTGEIMIAPPSSRSSRSRSQSRRSIPTSSSNSPACTPRYPSSSSSSSSSSTSSGQSNKPSFFGRIAKFFKDLFR